MARPKKEIKWEIVEKKMEAGCSAKEICGAFYIDTDTFYRRFKEEYGKRFEDYAASFRSTGLGNLRFRQYMKALEGNTQMLMFLGKVDLGQKEQQEQTVQEDVIAQYQALMNQLVSLQLDRNIAASNERAEEKSE